MKSIRTWGLSSALLFLVACGPGRATSGSGATGHGSEVTSIASTSSAGSTSSGSSASSTSGSTSSTAGSSTGSTSSTGSSSSATGSISGSSSGATSGSASSTGGAAIVPCDDDGGPCGSPELGFDGADVQDNPNDVLTAKVNVTTHGARSVWVLFQSGDGGVDQSPAVDAANAAQTLPVLGLAPSTPYRLQAIATDGDGGLARSAILSFTTQALPAFLSGYAFHVAQRGQLLPGYILISKFAGHGASQAAVIVDRAGRVAWYARTSGALAGDFQKQDDHTYTIAESTVGTIPPASSATYQQVDVLSDLVRPWTLPGGADIHDMLLEPNGDALMLGLESEQLDLTAYGGDADATLLGNTFVRVSPDGGELLSSNFFDDFDPGDVVPQIGLARTTNDAIHANSIGVAADGNFLVSARSLSQVRKLDAQTGKVLWKLGGARSDFTFTNDPLGGFTLQHFAREVAPDDILMFDDGNGHAPQHSRAVEYQLHFDASGAPTTAEMIWQYTPPPDANGVPLFANAMGSAQRLPDGHTLICYGTASRIDEVDAQGNLVWQLIDPNPGIGIYRGLFIPSLY